MNRLIRCTPRLVAAVLALVAVAALAPMSHAQNPAPVCTITSTPTTPGPNVPFELCGPSGAGYTYSWYDGSQNLLNHDRCLEFPNGLPVGSYDYEFVISQGADYKKCPVTVVIAETPEEPTCDFTITPSGDICSTQTFELCGPVGTGFTYSWYHEPGDVLISHDRCITEGPLGPGTYDYEMVVSHGEKFVKCPVEVTVKSCEEHFNCPRTVGWWSAQCDQKGNGSTKYDIDDVTKIAKGADDKSTFFNWSGDEMGGFCAIINPDKPMDQRKQAKRQFAGLLANWSGGDQGIVASNGVQVLIDLDTPISCTGLDAKTIGELITEVDAALKDLEGKSLDDDAVKTAYGHLIDCLDSINNGIGIGPVCPDGEDDKDKASQTSLVGNASLTRATPNPFRVSTQLDYSVKSGGAVVDIGVYDIAGRLVRQLASGYQNAGSFQIRWDGTNAAGIRMKSGVFFVRGRIGDERVSSRLLLLK